MDEYIKRGKANEAIKKERDYFGKFSYEEEESFMVGYQQGITFALSDIASIPAADVRPVVHGHWVYEEPNGANSFKGAYWCDQCHQPEPYRKNFCPNCGADMAV